MSRLSIQAHFNVMQSVYSVFHMDLDKSSNRSVKPLDTFFHVGLDVGF